MKQLNDSYPGWIFLPWKMKSKVDYALKQFSNMDDLEVFHMKSSLIIYMSLSALWILLVDHCYFSMSRDSGKS